MHLTGAAVRRGSFELLHTGLRSLHTHVQLAHWDLLGLRPSGSQLALQRDELLLQRLYGVMHHRRVARCRVWGIHWRCQSP